ncbi:hypothetical protein AMTRI_Chr07g26640 [Amborella trichopoda]|uniref:Chalcone synthase n=1 Tax=Amborella trichopoda TaxID=13333 RepID=W1NZ07_AMBTC|nr:chalcone synthase 1 [Amborella trichopoda]ERN00546.1 hypothetical protein AMTR_s00102p00092780 [Amborella trichopoda]|eukprot:XP_006837977.1 chalcone synthase 1 [Amborella trichopoda]
MVSVEELRKAQRADGPATVLAIGTANPPNVVEQAHFPDFYFNITNLQDLYLKDKFSRICAKSGIKKRHLFLTEERLSANPSLCSYMAPSLDARQELVLEEIPRLGKEAALCAIKEWGQPVSGITHLVFCTTSCIDMPGADLRLANLLNLSPCVNRVMLYLQGCFAGATALRIAKDLAENNHNARVLVVCSEMIPIFFRGVHASHLESLVGPALFGDGAAAVIIGSDPLTTERALYQLAWAGQSIVPDSTHALAGHLREVGLTFTLSKELPMLLTKSVKDCLSHALEPLGITDWNSIFYAAHPGGPLVMDKMENELGLKPEKLRATRHVLEEYGNMSSPSVLFVLDEMRKWSAEQGAATTGEGLEWGVLFGFGPGLTIETVVIRSMPT